MIALDRRRFMAAGTAACLGSVTGSLAALTAVRAAAPFAQGQAPGFYRGRVGAFEITSLSDGFFELPSESMATNAKPEERKSYFETRLIPLDKFRLQASPLLPFRTPTSRPSSFASCLSWQRWRS